MRSMNIPNEVLLRVGIKRAGVPHARIRAAAHGEPLIGHTLGMTALRDAAKLVRSALRTIDDIRSSALYRRDVAGNLLLRLTQLA